MNRIKESFACGRDERRARFVSYVCAGDPDMETSLRICRALIEGGTDILELGVPFSDPLADGLINQHAAERALASGANQERVFDLVRKIRAFTEIPIVFYTYYNLVYSTGVDNYVKKAKEAGVDGILTLDLPPEESEEFNAACVKYDVKTVYIIAPTTPPERIPIIAEAATGFLYYVSREGVTGVRKALASNMGEKIVGIRASTDKPLVVGFGISEAEHVKQVGSLADGIVVGSALVRCIQDNVGDSDKILSQISAKMKSLRKGLEA